MGPPDGRYLMRGADDAADGPPTHVLLFATLGAVQRRRLARRQRDAAPEPDPAPVSTGRATVIDVLAPLAGEAEARRWLSGAGEEQLERDLAVLNRALHLFRLISADADLHPVGRRQALVARIGYGAGEQVADGRWHEARELLAPAARSRRAKVLEPQARLAAVLGGRARALACEELVLRARADIDHGRAREAALQLAVALDAALAELPRDPAASAIADRLEELRGCHEATAAAAREALAGPLSEGALAAVMHALGRLEAALRARSVANG
ncbi:MAG TPA: hypothetical protein VL977_00090 [Solirubrobacteraceae bacterium]|nr:hypothetical protein [Solirubrobacteraceae bacterium]